MTRLSSCEATSRASPLVSVPEVGVQAASFEKPQALSASSTTVSTSERPQHPRRRASRRVSPATVSAGHRTAASVAVSWLLVPQDAEQPLLEADPARLDGVHPHAERRPGRAPGRAPSSPSSSAGSATVNQSPLARQPRRRRPAAPRRRRRRRSAAAAPRAGRAARRACRTAATRPWSRMTTRSQTRSTSPIRCELSSTATPRALQRQHDVADVDPAERVQRAGRLVQDDELRPGDQRDGQPEPLLHALGEAADPVAGAVGQADQRQALALLGAGHPRRRPAGRAGPAPRPRSARAGSGRARAGSRPGAPRPRVGRPAGPSSITSPASGRTRPEQHLDHGGLAGAVGPEQPEHLAAADGEGDVVDRGALVRTACAARSTRPPATAAGRRAARPRGPDGGRPRTVSGLSAGPGRRRAPRRRSATRPTAGHHAVLDPDHAGHRCRRGRPARWPGARRRRRSSVVTSSAGTGSGRVEPSPVKVAQLGGEPAGMPGQRQQVVAHASRTARRRRTPSARPARATTSAGTPARLRPDARPRPGPAASRTRLPSSPAGHRRQRLARPRRRPARPGRRRR